MNRLVLLTALAVSACATVGPTPVPPSVTTVVLEPVVETAPAPPLVSEPDPEPLVLVEGGNEETAPPPRNEAELADGSPPQLVLTVTDGRYRYTNDLSDDELARRWKDEPESLGTVAVGTSEEGRIINSMPFPEGDDAWKVIIPESCWTTQETADAITSAAKQLHEWFPDGAPVRVGQVSKKDGGYLWPHISHQNGRDVDIGLFYPGPEPYRVKEREKVMDVAMNWAFVKAVLTHADVQFIFLDWRVQKVLYDYALKHGENKAWLDSLSNAGKKSVFFHARKHRDHFHLRLYNPRAQELAHRLAPLMPKRPDENIAFHKVVKGDTLGGIAGKYGSSVKKIKEVNGLTSNALRLRQVLKVPLRGPCTSCPVPPLLVVPPRRVPPPPATSSLETPNHTAQR
jgi:LysM repeat protein